MALPISWLVTELVVMNNAKRVTAEKNPTRISNNKLDRTLGGGEEREKAWVQVGRRAGGGFNLLQSLNTRGVLCMYRDQIRSPTATKSRKIKTETTTTTCTAPAGRSIVWQDDGRAWCVENSGQNSSTLSRSKQAVPEGSYVKIRSPGLASPGEAATSKLTITQDRFGGTSLPPAGAVYTFKGTGRKRPPGPPARTGRGQDARHSAPYKGSGLCRHINVHG